LNFNKLKFPTKQFGVVYYQFHIHNTIFTAVTIRIRYYFVLLQSKIRQPNQHSKIQMNYIEHLWTM